MKLNDSLKKAIDVLNKKYKKQESDSILKTGIDFLEFEQGELIVLAAKPSMGKTAFSLSLVKELAVDNKESVGVIIPGTMAEEEIGQRLISICSGIDLWGIKNGLIKKDEIEQIHQAASKLFDMPIYLFNEPNCSFDEIEASIKNIVEAHHVRLIIVEGFEFIKELVDSGKKDYRMVLECLLSNFKLVANELHIPIMLIMNLPISEDENKPTLLDFKNHLVIPWVADKVLFIHRNRSLESTNEVDAKLIIAKNGSGCTGEIKLRFDTKTARFIWRRHDKKVNEQAVM